MVRSFPFFFLFAFFVFFQFSSFVFRFQVTVNITKGSFQIETAFLEVRRRYFESTPSFLEGFRELNFCRICAYSLIAQV